MCPNGPGVSPRVFVVPVCEPTAVECAAGGINNGNITIKDFLSFFIVDSTENGNQFNMTATLINSAGTQVSGGSAVPASGAFLQTVVLIR